MSIKDIICKESISFSKYSNVKIDKETLYLGSNSNYNYLICLYFDLPSYLRFDDLRKAILILYKIPQKHISNNRYSKYKKFENQYSIYPLEDFFSAYSSEFSIPGVDYSRKKVFIDKPEFCCTEIDITRIVRDCIKGDIENRGFLLMGKKNSRLITYASEKSEKPNIYPTLRLIYNEKDNFTKYITIPCDVKIKKSKKIL